MLLKIYSIRDSKAEFFNTPFFQKSHGEAERTFSRVVNDDKTLIAQAPQDFDLYYLGEYDDNKGTITPLDTPLHVIKAVQLVTATASKVTPILSKTSGLEASADA